ncbi:MAG: tRNA uridine(34) 5-carboxymethylaminomethyl modification radical SAM/GNAT enzyme Elp3 [Candidatus ainarchaeum sp.]|nr:tRNA uridine(34) 5-carboxymethylaminomethyl modification radical SAM/GNAT enzyme Elp3 [Candidatus ainarchaeum sp.]
MCQLENKVSYAKQIIKDINNNKINSLRDIELVQFDYCKKFSLKEIPTRSFILSQLKKPSKKVLKLLSIKPTRSLSGVQVIAVMLPPFDCPGKCVYCPSSFNGKIAPQSYTGFEPSTLRAQRLGYDPYKIVLNRISQLDATGNNANKIELIFQGSSFTALPKKQQISVVKKSIDAVTGKKTNSFVKSKKNAEKSLRRIVGITFETRPDLCSKNDIKQMLNLGGTRVELGVQNPDNKIYEKINRGHNVKSVVNSTQLLKDSGFKVLYHLMPGLPGSNYSKDLKNFKMIFSSPDFKPDMVKFYPCLIIKGTKLYSDWKKGNFSPMSEKKTINLLAKIKSELPPWVRVMRVNRDIPSNIISGGIKKTNLRQLIEKQLISNKKKCNCIRCREIGLFSRQNKIIDEKPKLRTVFYDASNGIEAFISMESKNCLYGFVRLRKPFDPFVKQIDAKTSLIRELHVYGKSLNLGERDIDSTQHIGYGKILLEEAERIAREKFDSKKMVIISGLGVREYYNKNFGYKIDEPFVSKRL